MDLSPANRRRLASRIRSQAGELTDPPAADALREVARLIDADHLDLNHLTTINSALHLLDKALRHRQQREDRPPVDPA